MTKKNPAGLRIAPGHYRLADIIIAAAFLATTIVAAYFAVVEEVRDYWALVLVGIIGTTLIIRRLRATKSA